MYLYIPLALFCISSLITPGPNNLMIMMSGINLGVKKSLPHFFGISLGFAAMVLIVGLGLGHIFEVYPILHQIIKVFGSVYMLYLAWKIINSNTQIDEASVINRKPLTFLQAALFQWVNPKAWVMSISAISAYTVVNNAIFQQIMVIAFLFFILGLPCIAIWLVGGIAIRRYLKEPQHLRRFNLIMGILLALSILLVFV